ncbi:MAG: glutamine--tRNA ligase/YqeY domain fusion protein [Planctomycetes bacterium]|nr:glutamine--tRNA ligase/YqeY domain fusion protein [Planctomycetota bacterium]
MSTPPAPTPPSDFLRELVTRDRAAGKHGGRVVTRFPPEPNGYLHIGHAKAICLNFGIAQEFGGVCNLRMDDTNPTTEDPEYVHAIEEDVRWLGFQWAGRTYYASEYFERIYECAEQLVRKGKAYVCDLSAEEVSRARGTLVTPGTESPFRGRSPAENLDLLRRMRKGEFPEGSRTLRARIDMAHPNMNLRDPVLYRIRFAPHYRTGSEWCIYPMYDYAHPLSDAFEGITHSLCTLEFEHHRPLYDWFLDNLDIGHPQQIEFARLNLAYTLMSKRRLLELVNEGHVTGWDDPRMPTLSAMRRRGYTPRAIRNFCAEVGVAKFNSLHEIALLEHVLRDDLNRVALRFLAVLRPLKVVITNYAADQVEEMTAINNPEDPAAGSRQMPFARELWIERDDFAEVPPKGFHRLSPGTEVRLRAAYIVRCTGVVKDAQGNLVEVHCTYDPESRSGLPGANRKVKATIHWVSARHALDAEVRLYDQLFTHPEPASDAAGGDFRRHLNPRSLEVLRGCKLEPSLASVAPGTPLQFERLGYFCVDSRDSRKEALVFNRTVTLRDTWAKVAAKGG